MGIKKQNVRPACFDYGFQPAGISQLAYNQDVFILGEKGNQGSSDNVMIFSQEESDLGDIHGKSFRKIGLPMHGIQNRMPSLYTATGIFPMRVTGTEVTQNIFGNRQSVIGVPEYGY